MSFTLITVTRDYADEEGAVPPVGTVTVQYSATLRNGTDTRSAVALEVPLVNGVFSATLPATDDPATTPLGASVTFNEQVAGYPPRIYSVALPAVSAPGVDLAALSQQVIGNPVTDYTTPPASGSGSYFFQQVTRLQVWTVTHRLGRHPFVQAFDQLGRGLYAQCAFVDNNSLTLTFPSPVAGTATVT